MSVSLDQSLICFLCGECRERELQFWMGLEFSKSQNCCAAAARNRTRSSENEFTKGQKTQVDSLMLMPPDGTKHCAGPVLDMSCICVSHISEGICVFLEATW